MQPASHPDRHLVSYSADLVDRYPATTELGRRLRQADAGKRLAELEQAEASIAEQEAANAAIADRIARLQAEHELSLRYLIEWGVTTAERDALREVLEEVARHGGLTLAEAAELASARAQRNGESLVGGSVAASPGDDTNSFDESSLTGGA